MVAVGDLVYKLPCQINVVKKRNFILLLRACAHRGGSGSLSPTFCCNPQSLLEAFIPVRSRLFLIFGSLGSFLALCSHDIHVLFFFSSPSLLPFFLWILATVRPPAIKIWSYLCLSCSRKWKYFIQNHRIISELNVQPALPKTSHSLMNISWCCPVGGQTGFGWICWALGWQGATAQQ